MSLSKLVKASLPFTPAKNKMAQHPSYTPVNGREALRKTSDDETVTSEGDSFLSDDEKLVAAAAPRRPWRTTYWRLGLEVLLLTASFTAMVVTLNPPQKPLKQRQVECGRLLGHWRESLPLAAHTGFIPD